MANKNNTPVQKPAETAPATAPAMQAGYADRTSDIVGTWDSSKGPIHFIPSHAIVSDGKKYKDKPSLLIFGKLVADCMVNVKQRDEDESDEKPVVLAKAGDMVGVWAKHGMKDIANLCGVKVFMFRDPTKDRDTGKDEKMKGYSVGSPDEGTLIPIRSDRREVSRGVRTFLDPQSYGKASGNDSPVPISGPKL